MDASPQEIPRTLCTCLSNHKTSSMMKTHVLLKEAEEKEMVMEEALDVAASFFEDNNRSSA